jgi:hypothetical protein
MTRWHRELFKRLEAEGVRINCTVQRANSVAIDCELNGKKMRYFAGISPSDMRAMDNAFHGILRTLRAKEPLNVC